MKRNLDGVYFRVQRNGEWDNVCFSDLTLNEREHIMVGRDEKWLRSMCNILADSLSHVGEHFDIVCE